MKPKRIIRYIIKSNNRIHYRSSKTLKEALANLKGLKEYHIKMDVVGKDRKYEIFKSVTIQTKIHINL